MPRLFATGSNGCGQLGIAHRNDVSRLTPCVFSGAEPFEDGTVVSLVSGGNHSLLLLATSSGRSIWAAGTNAQNQLGPGVSSSLDVWTRLDLASLRRAAGLVEDGTTYEPVAIACTWTSTLIAFSRTLNSKGRRISDVVVSLGSNDFGELGCGTVGTSAEDAGKVHVVRLPGWDGRDSRTRMEVQHLATGQRHVVCSCVLSVDGVQEHKVYGWGAARHGQLDVSSYSESTNGSSTAGPSHQLTRRASKYPSTHPTPTTLDLSPLPADTQITKITCGTSHTVLRLSTGTLITLGSNAKHQRDVPSSCTGVACTWNGTVGWDREGVWAVGSNTHGQLGRHTSPENPSSNPSRILIGDPSAPPDIRHLTSGSEHSLLLTETGTLYAWGWNEHGNLGIGSLGDQWEAVEVPLPRDAGGQPRGVRGMWAGCGTSWVLADG